MTYAPGWDCDMRCVRSSAHLRLRTRAHKLVFTPRIVIDTNSPAHAESSPHVRRTLDINRENDIHAVAGTLQTPISIHTPLAGSDSTRRSTRRSCRYFNPHSPCGERHADLSTMQSETKFQSTLPLRGATRGVRLGRVGDLISIHTPLAGSDFTPFSGAGFSFYFNPRSP